MTTPRIVRRTVPDTWRSLVDVAGTPRMAMLLAARGVRDAAELSTDLAAMPRWDTMKNVDAVADRLVGAIDRRERILVVADYDADGATACAVAVEGLGRFGSRVDFLVPNRFEFGYGLTPEIVDLAAARGRPDLIVTVDNGIASVEGVARAAELGIEVVVTDHHLPGAELPATPWIVNPNQPGCGFPSRCLAGVGVMFYLLVAVRTRLRDLGRFPGEPPRLADLLDLVALGTVADVVPLDATNRLLVANGLKRIRAGLARPGVAALFRVAGRDPARATAYDLGYVCGPRVNAAGRLADMSTGIRCLLARDEAAAATLARELDALNRERRAIEADMRDEALTRIGSVEAGDRCSLCLFDSGWHQGVIGIVASRLKDRLHRPAMVFATAADGTLRGSGRSIPALHLRDALDLIAKREPGLILRFGGHAAAAGLTLGAESFERFAAAFEQAVRERVTAADLERELATDGAIPVDEIDLAFAERLREHVWGQAFPHPTFDDEFVVTGQRPVGAGHLRLTLQRGERSFEAIRFHAADPVPPRIRAVYRPEVNEYQGYRSLQLLIEHCLPA